MMRTTLDIDDAVLSAARAIARDEGISIGTAVSRLAQRGLAGATLGAIDMSSGFPQFTIERSSPPITLDIVNANRD
jgi:hypothetical protein